MTFVLLKNLDLVNFSLETEDVAKLEFHCIPHGAFHVTLLYCHTIVLYVCNYVFFFMGIRNTCFFLFLFLSFGYMRRSIDFTNSLNKSYEEEGVLKQ